ncbi:aminotransferase [Marinitoga sp. 1135]|uniref:aminotransferase class I/II-fold pyridoxal phosphate-dependent enzyme n=1 Tax=Marinitoga sp. 1135 TaxID=1643333 RepID=UPI0015869C08|nr:aminotransferase class I/II-fold pyridoxal phosphate-dependent enzyme [Marinitoga sp. 1135]NUU95857.1 aminotransferase [Marinitoga sp. 1135]
MQAIILAAGMGKRLKELTKDNTKCMVKVNGITLIERMLKQLDKLNLSRIIIVIGYKGEKLKNFINTLKIKTPITYIENTVYYKTNNIYSLYLAKDYLANEDTILLESDIIFEDKVIERVVKDRNETLAVVSKFESWMDGTVVTLDEDNNIVEFLGKKHFLFSQIETYYKTVNIYKFSKSFSNNRYIPFLDAYCKVMGHNEYYEDVLKVISLLDGPKIKAMILNNETWYEIDDVQDLDIAESLFAEKEKKLEKFHKRYGGYWRYPKLIDFCYLVNPYYPNEKLIHEIQANFKNLLINYPSGLDVNNLLVSKYFNINKENIVIGNGAAELIKSLLNNISGKLGIIRPTFDEYANRYNYNNLIEYIPENEDFKYTAEDIKKFFDDKTISNLLIINPDNPSGNYIPKEKMLNLIKWSKEKNINIILDESFIDFIESEENGSLLENDLLKNNTNLIIIKSISKSFGVPGLRLGILATYNSELIEKIKKELPIWNINSFAEFYLQIIEKYNDDYNKAIKKFKLARSKMYEQLSKIDNLRVIPSEANYFMCELLNFNAQKLAEILLNDYNILIKVLNSKKGIKGEFIRVAIRTEKENEILINAIKDIMLNKK